MQDSQELINQITQQVTVSSTNTQTEAGQKGSEADKEAIINTLNQVFAEFELVYHNQFIKAFPSAEKLLYAKRLWFGSLSSYSAEEILKGARLAIKQSEFLPSVASFIRFIEQASTENLGLPDAHAAYIEACRAPSPKAEFNWSHLAVYYAGLASDWFLLANSTEKQAFPVFKRNYDLLCQRVRDGVELQAPLPAALPEQLQRPLDKAEQKKRMAELKQSLGWD